MAIVTIFAEPRFGKTAFATYLANQFMFDKTRNKQMTCEILQKNSNGFNYSIPKHCVFTNYDVIGRKFGYSKRFAYRFNPYRLGYSNEVVNTILTIPYGVYIIDEAQKYLNSRMSLYYPAWQSRFYEQHGHNYLDIYLIVQRPNLIDVNIRELSSFIEIVKMDISYNVFGDPDKVVWKIRKIDNSFLLDRYLNSGKLDKSCYTEEKIIAPGYILNCYDCRSCKPKHYEGHLEGDFELLESEPFNDSLESYIKYLEKFDDELPKGFYQKRSVS